MNTAISVNLSAAGTAGPKDLVGGRYLVAVSNTGTGTVDVNLLGPDGSTEITVASSTLGVWAENIDLCPGQYEVVVTGFTASVGGLALCWK